MTEYQEIIKSFLVFGGGVLAAYFTFKGTVKSNQASVDEIYTTEIKGIIDSLKTSLAEVKTELSELKQELNAKDELIQFLKVENAQLTKAKEDYKRWCRDKDIQIEKLKEGKLND